MITYKVFIEGKLNGCEESFLKTYINHIKPSNSDNIKFIHVGGWTKLAPLKNQLIENSDAGGINIVIFDADDKVKDHQHGGFTDRSTKSRRDLSDCSFKLFLFPNSNDDGDFEVLLEGIVTKEHERILGRVDN